jgi:competence protein ComEC
MPGSFDFARRAFFQGLGGVGFAISRPSIVRHGEKEGVSIWLASLRHRLTKLILETVPGPAGAIAAALMTGERAAIPEETLAAMRESGLAHLLAISGLHMGLIGGLLFFVVRFGLASIERLALRYPIKKMAAVAALLGSLAYLFISGATLPTQRAFLMLSLVMLAVMIDRSAISMNMIAWAAGVILLVAPESLMSVSFQMSFAAVTALVATYELHYAGKLNHTGGRSKLARSMFYIAAVLLTTLVAGAATAPFALYHFNQVALLGVLANLFAVPLTALWVMPCAIAAFLLMPLGLSELALVPMGWGIEAIVRVAETVQALPGSAMPVVAMPEWGFALMALGGLWLCLWRRSWRLFGLFPIVIGIAAISLTKTPDILVSDTGKLIAVKGLDERLVFQRHARGFVADTWRRRNGQLPLGKIPMAERPARLSNQRCDLLGCVLRIRGQTVALVKEIAALSEDCAVATIVISVVPVRKRHCQEPEIVIGRYDLWRKGAHALWLLPDGIKLETVAGTNSRRPWSIYPRQYR